jgi:predicted nucleic-acid-binding Zn-ribbon protein
MNSIPKCPKCGGDMEEGFIRDHGLNRNDVAGWIAGKPEQGVLGGTRVLGKKIHEVRTFCCQKCGYLESYVDR